MKSPIDVEALSEDKILFGKILGLYRMANGLQTEAFVSICTNLEGRICNYNNLICAALDGQKEYYEFLKKHLLESLHHFFIHTDKIFEEAFKNKNKNNH